MLDSGVSDRTLRSFNPSGTQAPTPAPRRRTPIAVGAAARRRRSVARDDESGYFCASRLEQVVSAWRLVYERYLEMQLIHENPVGIHTAPMAAGPHTCVICGPDERDIRATMTAIRDNAQGIPLDSVYAPWLNALRRRGRRLVEVGSLAGCQRNTKRGAIVLFRMMRWIAWYALHGDATDVVIGVHPRHAAFYTRCYGFEQLAPPSVHPLVRDNPVVPLRLRVREGFARDVLPRGLAYARNNPLPADAFSRRFAFQPERMRGSVIEAFLGSAVAACDAA